MNVALRETILTINGMCSGPFEHPHRCSALHCDHCGLCDYSEELIEIVNSQIKETLQHVKKKINKQTKYKVPNKHEAGYNEAVGNIHAVIDKEVEGILTRGKDNE